MASTVERLKDLIAKNLEVDGKPVDTDKAMTSSLTDQGATSMDLVSLGRAVRSEFGVDMTVEDCIRIQNLTEMAEFLDSKTS